MKIDELIQQGEEFRGNLNLGNLENIVEWLGESQLYVETKYKSLDFTKEFCSTCKSFYNYIQSDHMFIEEYYLQLLGSLKACKNHEEYLKSEKNKQSEKINQFKMK